MATAEQAQSASIARGLRFDAATFVSSKGKPDGEWIARASSEDVRTGKRSGYQGKGETESESYDALIQTLDDAMPKPDPNAQLCGACGQPLPGSFNSGRFDAP